MRICIDLDGVIAGFKKPGQTYADVEPIAGAIDKLKELKTNGHYIIIFTARHMKTCEANVGKVTARIGMQTLDWLDRHEVVYDEIFFGKPWADIYIDDNAFRFTNWDEIDGNGESLPISNEKTQKLNQPSVL
jgi:capsule biosynthesis phosphatase